MRTLDLVEMPSVAGLYARAAAGSAAVSLVRRERPRPPLEPSRLRVRDVLIELAHLSAYSRVCGFPLTGELPPTYLHVLCLPLQLQLLGGREVPLPATGLVHTTNSMTRHRPVGLREPVTLTAWAQDLQPHPRGTTVDLRCEAHVGDELVWSGVSRYLSRAARPDAPDRSVPAGPAHVSAEAPGDPAQPTPGEPVRRWRVPADQGRRYAEVSGDVNPIHLFSAAAKAFGFRRAIAHGMWTHARSLAELGPQLPEAYELTADFRRPVPLPSSVDVHLPAADTPSVRTLELRVPGATGYAVRTRLVPR